MSSRRVARFFFGRGQTEQASAVSQSQLDQFYSGVQSHGATGWSDQIPLVGVEPVSTKPVEIEMQPIARIPAGAQADPLLATETTYAPPPTNPPSSKPVNYGQSYQQMQENEKTRNNVKTLNWLLGALALFTLFIFLALIAAYLFAALYPQKQLNNAKSVVQQELDALNTTLSTELIQVNNTQTLANALLEAALLQDIALLNATIQAEFAGLPTIYAGPGLPAPTLGNNGSLFISTTNQSIWFKNGNVWQDVFNNTGGGGPGVNPFAGYWNASVTYQPSQIVAYNESFYSALLTNTNSLPTPTNPNWMLLMDFSNNTGPPGPPGAPGAPGPPGLDLIPRGLWTPTANYTINNEVVWNNTYYTAVANNTGVDPTTDPAIWVKGITGNGIVSTLNASQIVNGPFDPSLLPPMYVQGDVTGVGAYSPGLNEYLINTTLVHIPANLTINPSQINGSTFNPNELPSIVVNGSAVGVGSYNNVTGQYDITILSVAVPSNLTLNASQITGGPLAPSLLPPIYLQGDVTGSGAYNAGLNQYLVNTTVLLIPSNVTINASQIVGSTFNPNQLPMTFVNGSATGSGYYNNVTGQYVIDITSVTLPTNFTVNASQIVGQLPADLLPPIYLQGDVVGVGSYNAGLGEYVVNTTITAIPSNVTINASQINGSTFNPNSLPPTNVNGSAIGYGAYNNVTGQYDIIISSVAVPSNLTLNASQITGGPLAPSLLPPIYVQGDVSGIGAYNAGLNEYIVNTTLLVIPSNITINASQIVGSTFNPNQLPATFVNGSASGYGAYNNVTGQYDITILSVVVPSNLTINASQIVGPLPGDLLPPIYLQGDVSGVGVYDVGLGEYVINTTVTHVPFNATFNPNELPPTVVDGLATGYGTYDNATGLYNVTITSVSIPSNTTFNADQITNGTLAPLVLPPIYVQGDVSGVGTYDAGLGEYVINATVVHVPFNATFNPTELPPTIVNGSATGYGAYNNATGLYDVTITSVTVPSNLTLNASQITNGPLSPSLLPPIYLQGDATGNGAFNAGLNEYLVNTTLVALPSNLTIAATQITGSVFNLTNPFAITLSGLAIGVGTYNTSSNLYDVVVTTVDVPSNFTLNASQITNGPLSPSLLPPIYLQGDVTGIGAYNAGLNEYIVNTTVVLIPSNVTINASQIVGLTFNPNDLPTTLVNGTATGYGSYNNATGQYVITIVATSLPTNFTVNASQITNGPLSPSLLPPIYLQGDVAGTGAYNAGLNEYIVNTTITSIPPNVTINASQINGSTFNPNTLPATVVSGNATGYGAFNNVTGQYDITIASIASIPVYVPPTAVVFGSFASTIGFDLSRFTWNDTSYILTTTGNSSTFSVLNDYAKNGTGSYGVFLQLSTDGPSGIGTQGNPWLAFVASANMFLIDSLRDDIVLQNGGGRILISGTTSTSQVILDSFGVSFTSSVSFKAAVFDQTFSSGISGQVLTSVGSGIVWSSDLNVTSIRASANITANSFVVNGGTASQLLAADGSVVIAGNGISINNGTIAANSSSSTALANNEIDTLMYGYQTAGQTTTFPSNTTYPAPYQPIPFSTFFNPYFIQPAANTNYSAWGPTRVTGSQSTIYDFSTSLTWEISYAQQTTRVFFISLQMVGYANSSSSNTTTQSVFTFGPIQVANYGSGNYISTLIGNFDYTIYNSSAVFPGSSGVFGSASLQIVTNPLNPGSGADGFYVVPQAIATNLDMTRAFYFYWALSDYVNDPNNQCYCSQVYSLCTCTADGIYTKTSSSLFDPL